MRALLLLLISLQCSLYAQIPDTLIHQLAGAFPTQTQLALAVLKDGQVTYYGYQLTEEGIIAIDNQNHLFEIGSITKVMTSHLLAKAVAVDLVDLHKPIHKYLKYRLKGNPKITPLQLSNHTAGLPRLPENIMPLMFQAMDNPYRDYTGAMLKTYLTKELTLDHPPGKKMLYSNLGVGLLGQVLSKVWQQPYTDLLHTQLFQPLGMRHTYTSAAQAPKDQLVIGQNTSGEPTSNWDFEALAAAGCVISSVEDMSRYAQVHLDVNNAITRSMQVVTHTAKKTMKTGLGWLILQREGEHEYLFHNGGTGGYTSALVLNPTTNKGIIVLTNLSAFHPQRGRVDQIALQLLDQLH